MANADLVTLNPLPRLESPNHWIQGTSTQTRTQQRNICYPHRCMPHQHEALLGECLAAVAKYLRCHSRNQNLMVTNQLRTSSVNGSKRRPRRARTLAMFELWQHFPQRTALVQGWRTFLFQDIHF